MTLLDGTYVFTDLLSGTYRIVETQPVTYNDGVDRVGTSGGTLANDDVSAINLSAGTDATGYTFGERGTTVRGTVWVDANKDGVKDPSETMGLPFEMVELRDGSGAIVASTMTDASGNYTFTHLLPGSYTITEIQPNGYGSSTPNTFTVTVPLAGLTDQNFGETTGSLRGSVYHDANRNGGRDAAENGLSGVTVRLSGLDVNGGLISQTATTDANGVYTFTNLVAGLYSVSEVQPAGYGDGQDVAGSAGGAVGQRSDQQHHVGGGSGCQQLLVWRDVGQLGWGGLLRQERQRPARGQ